MQVAEAVGRILVERGVRQVFGVVGSGNFHVTNAMVDQGATFVAARHENGAATMTDAYTRMSGETAVLTVHQGCGLTNAMTGIAEAAKSRTPMLVLAAAATQPNSNFYVDQEALARAVGAIPMTVESAETAAADTMAAIDTARLRRRTVVLNLPLDVQGQDAGTDPTLPTPPFPEPREPAAEDLALLVRSLEKAARPVFVAGRGARGPGCRRALEDLAKAAGALLATSAVAKGLFNGNDYSLDVSGGFASPLAKELIMAADLIVGWGCALNMWTMSHGRLIGGETTVIQVDDEAEAIGVHRPNALGVVGDVRATAEAALGEIGGVRGGYRSDEVRVRISESIRWRDVPYEDDSTGDRIDARTLTIALDDLLPPNRIVSVDSGNFMGHPSMYLSVPDEFGVWLGLATAIGAALAQPDRVPVAALGDGGGLMSIAEMDTVARLGLPMVVVVYNDDAYGAEVHHFGPDGHDLSIVEFPPTDIASMARGFGFDALTVREAADLAPLADWVGGSRDRPLLIDAKVTSKPSWWLEEAFGH